jgi:hypothetical protein
MEPIEILSIFLFFRMETPINSFSLFFSKTVNWKLTGIILLLFIRDRLGSKLWFLLFQIAIFFFFSLSLRQCSVWSKQKLTPPPSSCLYLYLTLFLSLSFSLFLSCSVSLSRALFVRLCLCLPLSVSLSFSRSVFLSPSFCLFCLSLFFLLYLSVSLPPLFLSC